MIFLTEIQLSAATIEIKRLVRMLYIPDRSDAFHLQMLVVPLLLIVQVMLVVNNDAEFTFISCHTLFYIIMWYRNKEDE